MAGLFTSVESEINALYVGYFGRAGDPSGLQYWENQLNSGALTYQQIAASFSVQIEAQAKYTWLANDGSSTTAIQTFINSVYQDLFNRSADSAGLAYWTAQLQASVGNPQAVGSFILNVISGAQGSDATTITNKVTVANYITNYVFSNGLTWNSGLASESAALIAATTSASSGAGSVATEEAAWGTFVTTNFPTIFTLTTGVDLIGPAGSTLNGASAPAATGNDIIQGLLGAGATLNAFDNIAPGGTGNTLALVDSGTGQVLPLGVTISNIQTVTLQENGNAGTSAANPFNVSGISGVTTLTATSVGAGTDYYKAAATTNVTATALAGAVNVSGGLNDTVTAVTGITVAGAAGTVTATNSGGAGIAITGGTNIIATDGGAGGISVSGESGTVQATETGTGAVKIESGTNVSAAAAGGNITIGDVKTPSGSITATNSAIGLEGSLGTIAAYGGTSAAVTTTGSNSVTLGSASAPIAGSVQVTDTNTGSSPDAFAVLASGGVTLTTTPTSGAITIGNDATLNPAGTALANSDNPASGSVVVNNSVTYGSTTYYGTSATNIGTNGATSVSVTGAGTTSITDEQTTPATGGSNVGAAVGTSTLASVTLNHVGATTITSDALTSLSISNSANTVTVTEVATPSGTPSNALSLTLSNDTETVNDNTASSVVVATSGSSADTLTLSATKATSVTFQNGAALTFNGAGSTLSAATSLIADNTASLALGNVSGFAKLASINATASTGAVSVTLNEGASSTISFNGAGGGLDTVTIGSNTLGTGTSLAGATGSTLVANYAAATTDTALGTNSHISGFSTLALGSSAVSDNAGKPYTSLVGTADLSASVTIGGTWVAGNTVSLNILTGPGAGTYTYTATAGQTDAQVAAGLLSAVAASGDSLSLSGSTVTITSPSSTPFTASTSTSTTNTTGTVSAITVTTSGAAPTDQVVTFAVSGTSTGTSSASITLDGVVSAVTTTNGETAQQVANALVAAINASSMSSQVTASDVSGTSTTVTVTANTAGAPGPVTSNSVSGTSAGITVGAGANTAGTNGTAQVEHFTVSGTYAAGNVISYTFAGVSGSYTVTSTDAADATDQTLANDLVTAIHSATGFTVTDSATTTITVTDQPNGAFTDSVSVANGGTGTATLAVISSALPTYDATNFTALTVGGTPGGDVTFINVAAGVGLTVTANNGNIINYELKTLGSSNTLPLTVGVDGSTTGLTDTVATTGIQNLNINSVGTNAAANTLYIDDTAAKAITVTGDNALTLTLNNDAGSSFTSSVTSINASGSSAAVTVTGVTVSSAGATFTGGSGALTAQGSASSTATDVFNLGSGGGVITLGAGGQVYGVSSSTQSENWLKFATGSETVNLVANNPAGSTIIAYTSATGTGSGSVATINNFNITTSKTSDDKLNFTSGVGSRTIAANAPAGTFVSHAGVSPDLNYSVSNGIVTFAGTLTDPISNFSVNALIAAAAILDGANGIDAFQSGGNTYVVATDGNAIAAGNANPATYSDVSVTILAGVTGVQGFGSTAASNTILSDDVNNRVATSSNSGTSTAAVYNEAGFAIFNDATQTTLGSASTTLNNLAASAQLNIGTSEAALIVNQVGASGTNSLTINATGTATIGTLTVNGDDYVNINANGNILTINSFVDNTGTLPTLTITGSSGAVSIGGVTGSVLTTIDDSGQTGGGFTLIDALNGQTIKLGSDAAIVTASGAADVITQVTSTFAFAVTANGDGDHITLSNGGGTLTASGLGDVISVGTGTDTVTANNNGDIITLGAGGDTVSATGTGDAITFGTAAGAANTVTIGAAATVTYSTTTAGNSETVVLTASSETGATTSGAYNVTLLNKVTDGTGDKVNFTNVSSGAPSDHLTAAAVDVAAAATLGAALNAVAALNTSTTSGDHYFHWFQYGGNTYLVDNVGTGSALTAMGAHDAVVEITGLVNLPSISVTSHVVTL